MATNVNSVTNHFPSAENGFTSTLASTISSGATTVPLNSVAGYANGEVAVFVVDPTDAVKKQTFTGIIDTAGVQVTGVVWTAGTNQTHSGGATVVDYVTATHISMVTKGILVHADQDGTLKAGAVDNATVLGNNVVTEPKILDDAVTAPKLSGIDESNLTSHAKPYKFRVHLSSGAPTTGNNAFSGAIAFNTEDYDTNNNVLAGVFTAPFNGYWHFNWSAGAGSGATNQGVVAAIFKNGAEVSRGTFLFSSAASQPLNSTGSDDVFLAASDTIDMRVFGTTTLNVTVAATSCFLSGHLISRS